MIYLEEKCKAHLEETLEEFVQKFQTTQAASWEQYVLLMFKKYKDRDVLEEYLKTLADQI
jgi:acetone carboxylase gamma subunit